MLNKTKIQNIFHSKTIAVILISVLIILAFGMFLSMSVSQSGLCYSLFSKTTGCPLSSIVFHALFHMKTFQNFSVGPIISIHNILLIIFGGFFIVSIYDKAKKFSFIEVKFKKETLFISPKEKMLKWLSFHEKRDPYFIF